MFCFRQIVRRFELQTWVGHAAPQMCGSTAYEGSTPPTFALALIPSDIRSLSKSGSFWAKIKSLLSGNSM